MTLALAGLIAGFLHVLSGPDHLAAIAPYAVEGQRCAWRTGVRWGFGHTAGVLGVGLLALMFRDALHVEALSAWGERCVGLVLIGVGIWGMRAALSTTRKHADRPDHEKTHDHAHAAFAVGTVHGLAGSSHVLGIVPALLLPSGYAAAAYLLSFGAGSVAAMGTFSSLVGWFAGRWSSSRFFMPGALLGLCSAIAVAVGGFWTLWNP